MSLAVSHLSSVLRSRVGARRAEDRTKGHKVGILESISNFRCQLTLPFVLFGSRCGYTVEDVADGSIKLVHETSVKHYKDDMKLTLTDKVWSTWDFRVARFDSGGSCCPEALKKDKPMPYHFQSVQRVFMVVLG